jgi:hypothetical protein
MTMIDEETLRAALQGAADSIAVPDRAVDQILMVAQRLDARPRAARRFRRRPDSGLDTAVVAKQRRSESGPLDVTRQRRRPPRRVLVAAAAIVVLGVSLAVVTTLDGSRTSRLAISPTPTTTAGPPLRLAAPSEHGSATKGSVEAGPLVPSTAPTLPTGAVGGSSKVEETGSVDLTVGNGQLEPVLTRLTNLATAQGGFVASTQTQSGDGASTPLSSGSITLQVPQVSFGPVVAQAQTFGKVTALTTRGTDVTGHYVDLQARIAALEASRLQYLTIMSKATLISDVLAVQAQLDNLQTQIEQLQGQLQVLDSQTTYGTLVVSVSERGGHPAPVHHARSGIASAWHGAVSGFAAAFDGLIRIAGPALFVLLCLAAFAVFGRLAWRGIRRRTL